MRESNSVDMLKANGIWDDWVSGKRGKTEMKKSLIVDC